MSLDDLQAQLRGTLDQQFAALNQKYQDGLAEARRQAAADAQRDLAVKLEQARVEAETQLHAAAAAGRAALEKASAEWDSRLQAATAAARAETAREMAVKVEQVRAELEQARTEWDAHLHAVAAARAEGEQQALEASQQSQEAQAQKLEQAVDQAVTTSRRSAQLELESERRRGQNEVEAARQQAKADAEAERQRAQAELDGLRQRLQSEIAAARQAPTVVEAGAGVTSAAFERALAAIREIDGARTLSEALTSLLAHAGATAGRAALFLINADRLKAWQAVGIPDIDIQTVESSIGGKDLLARAIQGGQATPSSAALPAPPFARLPADRVGVAVPLMIGGRAVAVLYADSGANAPPSASLEIVEVLVRHTSAIAALRTAMRTLDVLGGGAPDSPGDGAGADGGDVSDVQGARRYARLLVSEIKLYNEAAVSAGRQQRDLLRRLRTEIDRAQQLYEERVPAAVGGRQVYFHQELVQTLADGDPALLGQQ